MSDVGLTAYRQCTFREKREVLRVFWSRREADSELVGLAAREYGPYALVLVIVIAVELAVIAVALVAGGTVWAWPAVIATGLVAWCAWWTWGCLGTVTTPPRGHEHASG